MQGDGRAKGVCHLGGSGDHPPAAVDFVSTERHCGVSTLQSKAGCPSSHRADGNVDGKENPADVLTKPRSSRDWCRLMKPLIFWRHADMGSADKIEGSDSRSPLPAPPVLVSGAPKQSEKLHLRALTE